MGADVFVNGIFFSCGIWFETRTAISTIKIFSFSIIMRCSHQTYFVHQTVQNYLNHQHVCPMYHPWMAEIELTFVCVMLLYVAETQNVCCEHKPISLIYYLCLLKLYNLNYLVCFCKRVVKKMIFTLFSLWNKMVATAYQNDAPQCTFSQKSAKGNLWIQIQSTISMVRCRCIYVCKKWRKG